MDRWCGDAAIVRRQNRSRAADRSRRLHDANADRCDGWRPATVPVCCRRFICGALTGWRMQRLAAVTRCGR